ncbi:MAG TPA: ABC transporter substrate-binding protein [Cyanobacteria bacterium UBA12227]|nr:ABC transporter substrate-binding protein [Cyanobacteria bacterium UBA12227]HAX90031.1 ABC transporter substrate-binding protein [Cyanobacteria bacterium UBA11370]HBY79873.1 ABC transporter substrate-binding protein [Cyanobacteria bacterium UBA11148]
MYGQSSPTPHSKILYLLTLGIISAIGLGSCTPSQTEPRRSTSPPNQTTPATNAELKIVTATLPITNFTKAVAGNQAEVTYLLPTNISPHEYQAKPEDARTLAQANVLVKNGLGMEEYLDRLIANANNPNLTVIDTSKDIEIIANEQTETHNHSEEKSAENSELHEHEREFNPHIWLDPQRAIQQVENIRDGLIAANPQGKETYTANAAAYINKLKALDGEIAIALKPYADKTFVTYHDFATYFAQRYNLKAEFLVGVPEENPSPLDVKRVIDTTKNSDLKTLLTEPQVAGNPFEALAKDLNIQVSNFDPMETSKPEGIEPDYYFTIMRQNLKNLQTAFGSNSTQSHLPSWFPTTPSIFQLNTPTLSLTTNE